MIDSAALKTYFTGLQTQDRNPTKTEFGYFKSRLSQLLITHQSKPAFH